jgi:quinol monooxygenase YgiN
MMRLFVAALVAACGLSTAFAADDPILAAVKAKVKSPDLPFTLIVTAKLKPGSAAKFEALFEASRTNTRKEPGNVTYQLSRDTDDATKYLVYERWKSVAAMEAHMKAEYVTKLLSALPEMLDGAPDVKVLVAVGE